MNGIRNIKTVPKVNAVVDIPTSKSITNRALIAAALAEGVSKIIDPSPADDCRLMIDALRKFGIKIEEHKDFLLVHGSSGKLTAPESEIYVGNAGTTMRFLAALASIADGKTRLVGTERMNQRPLSELLSALDQLGVKYESNGGFTPLTVYGGKLKGGVIKINGSRSSQFISSVLLVSPYADSGVELIITDKIISKPYVNLTLDLMNGFGVEIIEKNNSFFISNKARYRATSYIIEGDASSASYFFAAAAITCGQVRILNLKRNSRQGDMKFLDILQQMGCEVSSDDEGINVKGNNLSAISIDMSEIPDLVPTLTVVALFAKGKTSILNVKHLRYKETDRISALAAELRKLGAIVNEYDDGIDILAGKLNGSVIDTYEDHRIAMSFAVAGLKVPGVAVRNPGCVVKSFPKFWDEWSKIEGQNYVG